jgi:hypothetical protein
MLIAVKREKEREGVKKQKTRERGKKEEEKNTGLERRKLRRDATYLHVRRNGKPSEARSVRREKKSGISEARLISTARRDN